MKYTYKYKPEIYNETERWVSKNDNSKQFEIESQFSPVPQFIIETDMEIDELTKYLNEFGLDWDGDEEEKLVWSYDESVDYLPNGAFAENLHNVTEEEVELWQKGENEAEFEARNSWTDIIGVWLLEKS